MADLEVINNRQNEAELIINRWIIDFYYSKGIEFFQKDKKEDFFNIKHAFECRERIRRPSHFTLASP